MKAHGRGTAVAAALLALLVLACLAEALVPGRVLFWRDLGTAVHPVLSEARQASAGGVDLLPFWTNHQSNGRPLLANPGHALLHPANVLYLLLPFDQAFNLFIVLHVLLAGLAMLALARWLACGPAASFVAGVAFALGGACLSSTNLYPWMPAVAAAPLVLLATLAACRAPSARRLALLALACALSALGGQPEPVALSAITAFVLAVADAVGRRGVDAVAPLVALRAAGRAAVVLAGAAVWSLLLAAPQVVPAALHARGSLRAFGFTAEGLLYNSVHPLRIAWLFAPGLGGDPLRRLEGAFPGASLLDTGTPYFLTLYAGASVGLLALLAVTLRRQDSHSVHALEPAGRRSLALALAACALAGMVLSLGVHLPGAASFVRAAPWALPFRYPEKFLVLTFLALPLLAAFGAERVAARARTQRSARAVAALLAALVALDLGMAARGRVPTQDEAVLARPPLLAALDARARRLGLSPLDWRLHHLRTPGRRTGPSLAAGERTEQDLHRRMLLTLRMGTDVRQSFEATGDLLDLHPYFALAKDLHAGSMADRLEGLGRAGVLFVLTREPLGEEEAAATLELDLARDLGMPEGSGLVYRLAGFRPRAVVVPARAERPALPAEQGTASISAEDHRSLTVHVNCAAPCDLVVSDTLAPGWSATTDGAPTAITADSGTFRRVTLAAGEHDVRFAYLPPGLVLGSVLSLLGLVLVAAGVRRRGPTPIPHGVR